MNNWMIGDFSIMVMFLVHGRSAPTLEFAYILNAGTIHEGTSFCDFSILAPLHTFFGIFFYKIGVYDLDFA
jgi:hypothetical protein